ncbi:uncharacterized protein [Littorina saxatilis]|uniref:Short-chain collagen C4-like n=1 Tax=Littorina saxatilis TaxID=31220 RepID=A0AAN9G5C3_9CAEN
MGTITALFLLCLAASIFSCATLETETLSSDERLKRKENILDVNQQSDDISAHELSERSQQKKSITTADQQADEMEQLRRSLRSLEDWRTKSIKDTLRTKRDTSAGSTFVRWGRKSCPNDTSEVYVGVVGGKWYQQKGSGTNYLCLTKSPQFDLVAVPGSVGQLYGTEYELTSSHSNHDVPCSVCLAPKSATIMVPGTKYCPSGWTRQYYGHLVSNDQSYYATEYVCLDSAPEHEDHGHENRNGALFYYVVAKCGALLCPPYRDNKVVTCAVCSK